MLQREQGSLSVVPAIDLLDGNVVRLREGRYDQVTSYPVDPIECAHAYAGQGATLLHVVDLRRSQEGQITHIGQGADVQDRVVGQRIAVAKVHLLLGRLAGQALSRVRLVLAPELREPITHALRL